MAIALAAFAGLRQGEVRALAVRDVDLKTGVIAPRQAVWTELHALLVRHKLPERRFHALRHYFLTALVRGGANLEAVRELAGQ